MLPPRRRNSQQTCRGARAEAIAGRARAARPRHRDLQAAFRVVEAAAAERRGRGARLRRCARRRHAAIAARQLSALRGRRLQSAAAAAPA